MISGSSEIRSGGECSNGPQENPVRGQNTFYSKVVKYAGQEGAEEMNYYENVVVDYLRADRATFVNTECCIQLNQAENPDNSGPHWYCDAVALDLRAKTVFLCEISYNKQLGDLTKRIKEWHDHWGLVCQALVRDCFLRDDWQVRPWLFVPEESISLLVKRLEQICGAESLKYDPRITPLEMVQPWKYRAFNRVGEGDKPATIPLKMQA